MIKILELGTGIVSTPHVTTLSLWLSYL